MIYAGKVGELIFHRTINKKQCYERGRGQSRWVKEQVKDIPKYQYISRNLPLHSIMF
jgi:hypothetical protein